MRELTMLETGYLCTLVLLSLVLPLMMSLSGVRDADARRAGMKIVWAGQVLGAFAGVALLLSASLAPYVAGLGLVNYFCCALALLQKIRVASCA